MPMLCKASVGWSRVFQRQARSLSLPILHVRSVHLRPSGWRNVPVPPHRSRPLLSFRSTAVSIGPLGAPFFGRWVSSTPGNPPKGAEADQKTSSSLPGLSERAERAKQVNLSARLSKTGKSNTKEFRRLFSLIRNERKPLFLGLTLLLISAGITLTLPAVIGQILDAVNNPSEEKKILGLDIDQFFMAATGVFVVGAFAIYGRIIVLRSIGERIVSRLRSNVFRHIVSQDAEFFDANRTGDLISRLASDANVVSRAVTQNVADGLRSVLTATLGVAMMSYISLKLTGLITLVLPPVLVGTWLYGRKVRAISLRFQTALGNMTKVAEERLNNIRTAQSFGGEKQEIRLYNKQIRNVFNIAMQDARASGVYFGTVQLTGNLVVIGLLAMGASMVSQGSLTFGELSSFIMYTAYSGSAVGGLGNFYSELMKGAGAASRLFEVLDRLSPISPHKGLPLAKPRGDIEFHNVSFSYPTRPAVQIFNDLSFKIKSGSHVVIVGQSGGGKSTVAALLMRFYDPNTGYITIGGQKLSETSPWSLRQSIGVVAQEPVLFHATVAENIKYGKPDATREEILAAAAQANCTFLADFPDGIDTVVGPRGTQLSGGQKQRIAIARAIIKQPAVLILDEATSALDGESERLVNDALRTLIKSTATTISIAHRLSTIARAKQVIVLGSGGKVIEQGLFSTLYNDPNSALSDLLLRREQNPVPQRHDEEDTEDQEDERDETKDDEFNEEETTNDQHGVRLGSS